MIADNDLKFLYDLFFRGGWDIRGERNPPTPLMPNTTAKEVDFSLFSKILLKAPLYNTWRLFWERLFWERLFWGRFFRERLFWVQFLTMADFSALILQKLFLHLRFLERGQIPF